MGKLLSARKMLLGSLTKTGKVFIITAKSVDVETGKIDFAESERCAKEEDLELASKILAVKLVNKMANTSYSIPMRTYQQDEERNRFAIGLSYRYGIMNNLNVPLKKTYGSSIVISDKMKISTHSIIISPSYEINRNLAFRTDFKYTFLTSTENKLESFAAGYHVTKEDMRSIGKIYGIGINSVLIYPLEGFSFFIAPGIGIDIFQFEKPFLNIDNYTTGKVGEINVASKTYLPFVKIEIGFSAYISKFVELFVSTGVDYHIAGEVFSDVKVESTNGSTIPVQNDFKGNHPPEYYISGGFNFRVF